MSTFSVFGANGRIGSAFVHRIQNDEMHHVNEVPRRVDKSAMQDLGHVIFAAGVTADFRQRPYDTMRAHVGLISDVLEYGTFDSLTYLSSTRLYQNASNTSTDAKILVNPADPSDLYTLSKLAGEALCLQADDNVRIARLSNVVGVGEIGQDTFIGQIASEAISGQINLRSALSSEKDYIWLDDIIDLLVQIPQKGRSKIYNLAKGENITHKAWVDALIMHTNCELCVKENADEMITQRIDISKTIKDFDIQSKPLLGQIIDICSK